MKLVPEAKQWYKLDVIRASMALAALEALRTNDVIVLPDYVMVILIMSIAALRLRVQEELKRD
jgi:hypothetical protein